MRRKMGRKTIFDMGRHSSPLEIKGLSVPIVEIDSVTEDLLFLGYDPASNHGSSYEHTGMVFIKPSEGNEEEFFPIGRESGFTIENIPTEDSFVTKEEFDAAMNALSKTYKFELPASLINFSNEIAKTFAALGKPDKEKQTNKKQTGRLIALPQENE